MLGAAARPDAPATAANGVVAAGDDAWFSEWRARELTRVERAGITYVDYTGAALYPESLVRADATRLEHAFLGNPHSQHLPSQAATHDVDEARRAVLDFLHADPAEYAVVFTANASAACRLVAEAYPFARGGAFLVAGDNHNSVNGIREYARVRGTEVRVVPLDETLSMDDAERWLDVGGRVDGLFAFPAQSNFSGVRHPLALIGHARARGWRVLLDAASFVPTADLRLDQYAPDYVALSLYKIAGYPTGVGALVARHEALAALQRPSFAGGTVEWVSVEHPRHRLSSGPAGFEDGTVSFLALGAVAPALDAVRAVGRPRLARHLAALTADLLDRIAVLRHRGGAPVVAVHGPPSAAGRGATVALTVRRPDGRAVPYWEVEAAAREAGIALRGGCFCNPGCAERAFGVPAPRLHACLDALGAAFSVPSLASCLGPAWSVGAVRVSLGLGSVRRDVARVADFLGRYAA